MEAETKVLDLLDELEELLENKKSIPIMNKILVEAEDVLAIAKDIRLALPDDMKQAKWIRDERDRIINEAKSEYERIINEAKKQAEYLIETDDITKRARQLAGEIIKDAEHNSKILKMKTYDYVDKILYDMQDNMEMLQGKYFQDMFTNLENTFNSVREILDVNREEIKKIAIKTQQDEDED